MPCCTISTESLWSRGAGLVLVELLNQVSGMGHLGRWEPGILRIGVSLPLDQVQYPFMIRGYFGLQDLLNFIVFVFSLDNLRRGSGEVWSVGYVLNIQGDQGVVEDWMDVPCLWQLEFAVNSLGG